MRHARVVVSALGLASLAGAARGSDNTIPVLNVTSAPSYFTRVALGPDGSRNVLDIVTTDVPGIDHHLVRRYPLVGAAETCTLPIEARALAVQPDGKLVAAGEAEPLVAVVRLQATGCALDPTFGLDGIVTQSLPPSALAWEVAIQKDGKIVLAGERNYTTATGDDFFVMRLNADGTDDTSFNGSGVKMVAFNLGGNNNDVATALALQADGKILVGGKAGVAGGDRPVLARLTSTGALDTTFNSDGKVEFAFANTIAVADIVVQPDQVIQLLISGSPKWLLAVTSGGRLDPRFASGGALQLDPLVPNVRSLAGQSDGKLLVSGFNHPERDGLVARFTKAGDLDTSFGVGGTVTVVLDSDDGLFQDVAHQGGLIVAVGKRSDRTSEDNNGLRASLSTSLVFTDTFSYGLHPWDSQVGAVDRVFQSFPGGGGTYRLRAAALSGQPAYVETDAPPALTYVKVRFDLRAGGLAGGRVTALDLREEGAGQSVAVAEVEPSAGSHRVRGRIKQNDGTWLNTAWVYLFQTEHEITVEWYRDSTGTSAVDGRIRLHVDGQFLDEAFASNSDHKVGKMRLGAVAAAFGASGTLQFDDFGAWRF